MLQISKDRVAAHRHDGGDVHAVRHVVCHRRRLSEFRHRAVDWADCCGWGCSARGARSDCDVAAVLDDGDNRHMVAHWVHRRVGSRGNR